MEDRISLQFCFDVLPSMENHPHYLFCLENFLQAKSKYHSPRFWDTAFSNGLPPYLCCILEVDLRLALSWSYELSALQLLSASCRCVSHGKTCIPMPQDGSAVQSKAWQMRHEVCASLLLQAGCDVVNPICSIVTLKLCLLKIVPIIRTRNVYHKSKKCFSWHIILP